MAQHDDPDQHDRPRPTEAQVIVANIKRAYEQMTEDEKEELFLESKGLNELTEEQKREFWAEVELDLL